MQAKEYKISKETSNKIKLIGFFSIVALIYVHNGSGINTDMTPSMLVSNNFEWNDVVQNFILNGLLRFRLPFMMLVSGFFLFYRSKNSYLLLLKSKFKTIILPYFLISISGLFITFLFETFFVPQGSVYAFTGMLGKKMVDLSITEFISYIVKSPIVFQLWYLRVLLMFILFVPILKYLITKIPIIFLGSVFLVWLFTNHIGGGDSDRGYLFFFLGAYFAIHKIETEKQFTFFSAKSSLTVFLILAIIKTYITFYGNHFLGHYTSFSVSFLYKLNEIFGLYAVWFVFDKVLVKMLYNEFWLKITESSFFIYAFHSPLIVFLNKITRLSSNIFSNHIMFSFLLMPLLVLIVTLVLEDTIKRISGKFYTMITGGRSKAAAFNFAPEMFRLPQLSFTRKLVFASSFGSFILIAVGAAIFFR